MVRLMMLWLKTTPLVRLWRDVPSSHEDGAISVTLDIVGVWCRRCRRQMLACARFLPRRLELREGIAETVRRCAHSARRSDPCD